MIRMEGTWYCFLVDVDIALLRLFYLIIRQGHSTCRGFWKGRNRLTGIASWVYLVFSINKGLIMRSKGVVIICILPNMKIDIVISGAFLHT